MTIYIQLGLNQVCIMQFLRIFFNSFSHGISYITLCIVVAEILEFRSVQKKNCKGPRQDHSHNSYKSKTTKQFLNNRTIKLSQSNCIIGSASINAEFHINTKILKNLIMSTKGTFMQGLPLLFGLVNSDKMSMYHDDSCIVIGREVMIISDMVHWTK